MFTGIVQTTGTLVSLKRGAPAGLTVRLAPPRPVAVGDSVAVNGACLTLVQGEEDRLRFDLSRETLSLSHFTDLRAGAVLNIELPLRLDDVVGGHLVSGHLDGTVRVRGLGRGGGDRVLGFTYTDPSWRRFLVPKGSVSLNGVSLTLVEVRDTSFSVAVIPHTWKTTNLGGLRVGERVNVELDLIAKYLYNLQLSK